MPTTATQRSVTGEAYYAENYGNYAKQNPPHKMDYYLRWVERYSTGKVRLHDVGCGLGLFLNNLPPSWEICGSDVNAYAVEQASAANPRGKFAVGSGATELLFEKPFDVVTAFDVLEHVPDLDRTAEVMKQQLKPGKLLLFVVPVYDGLSGPLVQLLDKDPTHLHKNPRQFWIDWAQKHFELLAWEGVVRYLLPGGYYLNEPSRLFRRHTPAILVACRRR